MSAPQRVSVDRIRETLEQFRGNISGAAQHLGIARNNLYKRIVRANLDLAAIRGARSTGRRPLARSMRVSPELFARLREAKFDLQHSMRTELDEGDVLRLFAEDAFEAWLTAKTERRP